MAHCYFAADRRDERQRHSARLPDRFSPASTIGVITPVSVENSTFVPPPPPPPPPPPSLPSSSPPDGAAPAQPPSVPPLTVEKANRWQFTDKDCARSASRRDGMSAEDELLCRSKAVAFLDGLFCRINNLYQKGRGRMGTGILCTAIIHLQRFYYFHSFSGPLDYRDVAAAILFLTAKLEEIPHKLEEVTTQWWHQKHPRADPALLTTARLENGKQLLMFLENMVLQTIGFDVSVELPQSIALQQIMLLSKSGQREVADKIKDATVFFTTELIALTDWALRYTPRQIATVAFKIVLLWSQFETAVPDSFLRDIDPTVPPEHLDYMVGTYVSSRQRQREVLPTLESIMQRNQFLSSTRQRGLQLAIKSSGGDGAWRPSSTTILPPPPPPPPPSLLPPSLSASPAPRSTTAVQRGPPPPPPPPSNHNQQQSQKQQQSNPNVAENPIKKLGLAEYKERQHQTQNAQQSKSAPPPPQPDKYKLNPPPPPPPSLMSGLGSGSSGRRDREQRTQHHGYQHHQSRHRDHDVAREHERKRSHEQKDEPPRESKRARPTSGISPPSNGLTTTTSSGAHVSAALPLNGLQRVTEDDLEDGEVP